ncbi:uncharacterized protein JCM15063_005550 [Sporobolomyces koalae]|uniref:uncharacterized protein n=1 Tax=Sporobolomyces koalae TaxID=500713 RepID=UPI0031829583
MASLIRDSRQPESRGAVTADGRPGYVPAQTGSTREMVADSQMMGGLYAPYDPPIPIQHRQSVGNSTLWSERTMVDSVAPKEEKLSTEGKTETGASKAATPVLSPPPTPTSRPSSSPPRGPQVSSESKSPATPGSRQTPVARGHTRQASSGAFQPKGLMLVNNSSNQNTPGLEAGEAAFSTPKPTASPLASLLSNGIGAVSSSAWTTPVHAKSPAPSEQTYVSSAEPPRVDLKRTGTWSSSISSWIPNLSANDKAEEEETMKLVDQALKNAR